jgi:hypothetical protein
MMREYLKNEIKYIKVQKTVGGTMLIFWNRCYTRVYLNNFKFFKNLDEQGCGDKPKILTNERYLLCNKPLCNEDYDAALFCLNKEKDKNEFTKGFTNCDKECYVYRDNDGKRIEINLN